MQKYRFQDMMQAKMKSPSIRLNGTIPAETTKEFENDGNDDSDNSKLKVKLSRILVQSIITPSDVTLYISGNVNNTAFIGNNTIRVVGNQKYMTMKKMIRLKEAEGNDISSLRF